MHIITNKALKAFYEIHADAAPSLIAWYNTARKAQWKSVMDVRKSYPHADAVKIASGRTVTVFNIAGNKYRLVTGIHYDRNKIFVLRVMDHKQYSLNRWKETL